MPVVNASVHRLRQPGRSYFQCRIAKKFYERFIGLALFTSTDPPTALLIPGCRAVHSIGLHRPFQLVFLDAAYRVLVVHEWVRPWRFVVCRSAAHALESYRPLALRPGDRVALSAPHSTRMPDGFSVIETLIALPILITLALTTVQMGLLWHAKYAVSHAAMVAARQASVNNGNQSAIRDGLVQGLMPLVGKVRSASELTGGLFRAGGELTMGLAAGWIQWQVLSPTQQSFLDWGRPADVVASPDASRNDIEIPSAPMPALAMRLVPRSGVSQWASGLPVGSASGQTLVEANTLKLHLKVGAPLSMPIAGKLMARALAVWSGCGWSISAPTDRLGLLNFGRGTEASMLSPSIECRALAARDSRGQWAPRWPVAAFAVVTMQSSARQSVMVLRDRKQIAETP